MADRSIREGKNKLPENSMLNLIRFLAAIWVLLFHAQIHFGEIYESRIVTELIGQGVLAMTLFFMLSGFVLSMRYKAIETAADMKSFYIARIARLYPVYLFMGLVTIWSIPASFEEFMIPSEGFLRTLLWTVFIALVFIFALQSWLPSLFSVWNFGGSWSLSVEAFFYIFFPYLREKISTLSDERIVVMVFLTIFASSFISAGLLANLKPAQDISQIFYIIPIYRLPEFIFGMLVFVAFVERGICKRRFLLLAGVSFIIGVYGVFEIGNLPGNIEYGPIFMPAFGLAFVMFLHWRLPLPFGLVANYLGHISYAVYIVQFGTIPIFKTITADMSAIHSWIVFVSCNFAIAILVYHLIEKRFYGVAYRMASAAFNRRLTK